MFVVVSYCSFDVERFIAMIHHSCDRCKRMIDVEEELRYSVHLEVKAVFGTHEGVEEEEDDSDHLLELHEILERIDDLENGAVDEAIYQRKRFDLCPDCYRQFIRNPVGRDTSLSLGFSSN
jgi:hypothetical protein